MTRPDIRNKKLPGEITPRRAARLLGIHEETVYRWCRGAFNGGRSPLDGWVRRSVTGWYYIDSVAIRDMLDDRKPKPTADETKV